MKNEESKIKQIYLSEFSYYDDDDFVTFNLVDVNTERNEVMVAVSDRGKISVITTDFKNIPTAL